MIAGIKNWYSKKDLRKVLFFVIPLCFFLIMVMGLQKVHDLLLPPFTTKTQFERRILLPPEILPYVTFGFTNVLADYYWVRSIQDFITWDGKDLYYLGYLRNISALDSNFEYPYLFNILAVPKPKDVPMLDSIAMISKPQLQESSPSWKIPFYLGTQYYFFTKKEEPAKRYLYLATTKEDSPPGVFLVYSSITEKVINSYKVSRDLVRVISNTTDNETLKKLAERGLANDTTVQILKKGILAYHAKYKKFPKTVDELIEKNFVTLPQGLLDDFTITINPKNGSFRIRAK